jgi:hypothetical protein
MEKKGEDKGKKESKVMESKMREYDDEEVQTASS